MTRFLVQEWLYSTGAVAARRVTMLPIKTTIEDIDALGTYLKGQVGWVPLERAKKAIDGKLVDARKLEAQKRIGFIERDGTNVKLSPRGRAYATSADEVEKERLMSEAIREVPIYLETVEWIHHSKVSDPTKTDIGNYWHDRHQDQLEGAQGAALTDAVIFFIRVAGAAGLGKFTRGAGARPDSYLKTDASAIEAFVTPSGESHRITPQIDEERSSTEVEVEHDSVPHTAIVRSPISVEASPAVHVNIEIHIAADATAETIAEIFKNMRKYVLSDPNE